MKTSEGEPSETKKVWRVQISPEKLEESDTDLGDAGKLSRVEMVDQESHRQDTDWRGVG